jgi:hypothetical protein
VGYVFLHPNGLNHHILARFLRALAGQINRRWLWREAADGFANEGREGVNQKRHQHNQDNQDKKDALPRPIRRRIIIDIRVFLLPFVVHGLLDSPLH